MWISSIRQNVIIYIIKLWIPRFYLHLYPKIISHKLFNTFLRLFLQCSCLLRLLVITVFFNYPGLFQHCFLNTRCSKAYLFFMERITVCHHSTELMLQRDQRENLSGFKERNVPVNYYVMLFKMSFFYLNIQELFSGIKGASFVLYWRQEDLTFTLFSFCVKETC